MFRGTPGTRPGCLDIQVDGWVFRGTPDTQPGSLDIQGDGWVFGGTPGHDQNAAAHGPGGPGGRASINIARTSGSASVKVGWGLRADLLRILPAQLGSPKKGPSF